MDSGDDYRHGFPDEVWEEAKEETRALLKVRAKRGHPISYSDLCSKLTKICFEPHDQRLAHFLGQISTEEHENGKPLLSALVVHKHDNQPGDGFFNLAESLGMRIRDREEFWLSQIDALRT